MVFGTHHICIKTADPAASREFYEKALGFVLEAAVQHTPATASLFLVSADGLPRLQLLSFPGAGGEHSAYGHLGVQVEDIHAAWAFHQAMGIISQEIVEQPHQLGYFIRDPDGYEIEICQLKNREPITKERNAPYEDYKH